MSIKSFKNTEILYVIDSIAREKSINPDDLFIVLEEVIKETAKTQYGHSDSIAVKMDKKGGNIRVFRNLQVVSDEEFATLEDKTVAIPFRSAQAIQRGASVGSTIEEELPPFDMSRISAYLAKDLIVTKIRELEIDRQYRQLEDKVGEIVTGIIRSIDKRGARVTVDGIETFIGRAHMIRGDNYKQGDRIRMYLVKIEKNTHEVLMHLSRTHNEFLSKLLRNEVLEIQDGLIEIKGVVREPGSKAKVSVYSPDRSIDAVGSCVGIKGSRIQAVTNELAGERIDVVRWAPEPAQYVINCFHPIQILRIIVDEENSSADIEVMDKDLRLIIGRQGQNIRLVSKLTGMHINVNSAEGEDVDDDSPLAVLMSALDIDDILAQLLIAEGFEDPEAMINAGEEKIAAIQGLDEGIAAELILRAHEYLENQGKAQLDQEQLETEQADAKSDEVETQQKPELSKENISELMGIIKNTLQHAGITDLQSIAEMSSDELYETLAEAGISIHKEKLDQIIMSLRSKLFFNVSSK